MSGFRVRRVLDDVLPRDRRSLEQVRELWREQFADAPEREIEALPARLRGAKTQRFRTLLFVAEDMQGNARGFAIAAHDPENRFLLLEWIAAGSRLTGRGIGGALYQRVREEAAALGCVGVLLEAPPDEREPGIDDATLRANVARLRFYERFGARPIEGTAYRTPVRPDDRFLPLLVLDPLDGAKPLRRNAARQIVRAILEGKYGHLCPAEYVERVVDSVRDDPVRLRAFRYVKDPEPKAPPAARLPPDTAIPLVVNDKHDIHHIRERGYVESPVRIGAILKELEASGLFERRQPRSFGERHLLAVHDADYVRYLERACESVPAGRSVYPYVFPVRNVARPPEDLSVRAGYFCIDTFTPINVNAYPAARRAVDCALTAAAALEEGRRLAYALVRPPGHHAEHRAFGGFCYFNSNAVAAHYLSRHGRVAILDVDYHHGNGQQDIFWERGDVLTISIHGHPRFAYPYFSGFEDERGHGAGLEMNRNYPMPEKLDGQGYREVLRRALRRIERFEPTHLVVPLGLDPAKGDPTGTWSLTGKDFEENGRMIGALRLPTLVVQEGGYRTRTLGSNARRFFTGLWQGIYGEPRPDPPRKTRRGTS